MEDMQENWIRRVSRDRKEFEKKHALRGFFLSTKKTVSSNSTYLV